MSKPADPDPPGYRIQYGDDNLLHVTRISDESEVGEGFESRHEAIAAIADSSTA